MSDLISRQAAIEAIIARDANCGLDSAEVVKRLPSAEPKVLDETDLIELRDRFGDYVEFVVRDMISGKGERWNEETDIS